jgi:hypothetical protein
MPLTDLNMVAMPRHGTLHDLAVYAGIAAELVVASPFLQIEEITEELEGIGFAEQSET